MAVASSSNLKLNFPSSNKPSPFNSKARLDLELAGCIPVKQQVASGIMCESCSGRGWLLCEFCKGRKTNVKTAEINQTYRRCPACKSISSRHFYSLYRDGVYHQAICLVGRRLKVFLGPSSTESSQVWATC